MYLHEIPSILFSKYKDPLFLFPEQRLLNVTKLTIAPAKFPNTSRNGKSDFSPFLVLSKGINVKDLTSIEVILSTSIEEAIVNYTKMPSIIRIHCGMFRRSEESDTLHDAVAVELPKGWGSIFSDFPVVAQACFDMARRAMEIHNNPQKYHLEFRPDKEDK